METFFELMSAEIDETFAKTVIFASSPVLGYLLYLAQTVLFV